MSDVAVMAALIQQNAYGTYRDLGGSSRIASCTGDSATATAKALYAAGFRMAADDTDAAQNEALRTVENRLARLEGWAGMPPWYEPPATKGKR